MAAVDAKASQQSDLDKAGIEDGVSGLERVLVETGAVEGCLRSGAKPYARFCHFIFAVNANHADIVVTETESCEVFRAIATHGLTRSGQGGRSHNTGSMLHYRFCTVFTSCGLLQVTPLDSMTHHSSYSNGLSLQSSLRAKLSMIGQHVTWTMLTLLRPIEVCPQPVMGTVAY